MTETGASRFSRRQALGRGAAALAGAAGLGSLAAACGTSSSTGEGPTTTIPEAPPFDGTLRVLGLSLDLFDEVHDAAERDLGFPVAFDAVPSSLAIQRVATQPGSFDLVSAYASQLDQMWPTGNLVGLDRSRIASWKLVSDLYKVGVDSPGDACTAGDGDAPFRKLYTTEVGGSAPIVRWGGPDGSGARGRQPPAVTGAPSTYGLDAPAYDHDVLRREPPDVSWAELFNASWRGRVALYDEPSVGFQTAALAAESLGLMRFADKGDMTKRELDALTAILVRLDRKGQFRAFWATLDESVDLLAQKEVVIEYAWWPAVELLQASRHPARYAAPTEGYLAWAGLLCVSKRAAADRARLQACYDYIDWWQSGIAGAILMPYGYYNSAMETTRPLVSQDDWGYWIEGRQAPVPLNGPFGQRSIPRGALRDGGSMAARTCRIGTWVSHFDHEYDLQLKRWNGFTKS